MSSYRFGKATENPPPGLVDTLILMKPERVVNDPDDELAEDPDGWLMDWPALSKLRSLTMTAIRTPAMTVPSIVPVLQEEARLYQGLACAEGFFFGPPLFLAHRHFFGSLLSPQSRPATFIHRGLSRSYPRLDL